jgi:hypothetical protein
MPIFSSTVSLRLESNCSLSEATSKYGCAGALGAGKISRIGGSSGYSSGYLTCKNMVGGSESSPSSFVTSKVIEIRYSDSDISVTVLEKPDTRNLCNVCSCRLLCKELKRIILQFRRKGGKQGMGSFRLASCNR